ncbi:hypothetical protein [uncultured Microbulbifer sp.]|uniref:hypothetical protein n=1 Tax=uncultured Microbulbifer sp. TaxID=348147 RepID=UPI00261331C7|nr:hypothetical protein [uncultured Microbulbifer sp.]
MKAIISELFQKSIPEINDYECGVDITDAEILKIVERYRYSNQEMKDMAINYIKDFLFPQARITHLDALARCFAIGLNALNC